ncbi:hypothetical protein ACFSC6_10765 [Rufibacter sediminis]|uniref:Uncharacterized protein n=1 Tax=Rufibacter sediminis TaxID=2762756 RepID=A0ABR6VR09_9BACT|nr:hypothetical protein [Rufibacter sediminis]MBC3539016.1 hypothetical protein [Rufibacter sediminis]
MKKLLVLLLGAFAFACGNTENNAENSNLDSKISDESVEIGSGDNRNPQVEYESDTSKDLEVDTVSSAAEINQRQQ